MTNPKRSGNRWTVNEELALQREYELLEMSIQQIALKHQRTVSAILSKMHTEGIIDSWNQARGFDILEFNKGRNDNDSVYEDECCLTDDDEHDNNVGKLSERVYTLETNVKEIGYMVKKLFDNMSNTKQRVSSYNA